MQLCGFLHVLLGFALVSSGFLSIVKWRSSIVLRKMCLNNVLGWTGMPTGVDRSTLCPVLEAEWMNNYFTPSISLSLYGRFLLWKKWMEDKSYENLWHPYCDTTTYILTKTIKIILENDAEKCTITWWPKGAHPFIIDNMAMVRIKSTNHIQTHAKY